MLIEKNKYGTLLWKFYIHATGIISPETFSPEMGVVAALRGTPCFQLQDMHLGRDMPQPGTPAQREAGALRESDPSRRGPSLVFRTSLP